MGKPYSSLLCVATLCGFSLCAQAKNDVETARLATANDSMPTVVQRYQALTDGLESQFQQHTDELKLTQAVAHQGLRLWQQAVRDVQSGHPDDRSLYWNRLAMEQRLDLLPAGFKLVPWQREILNKAVEKSSRGFSDIHYDDDVQIKILLTGFDPFFLDRNIGQSNPSGLLALALDGYKFSVGGKQAQVETVMIPVRFADFDQGIIESLLTPVYRENQLQMVLTVSMGRDDFDLERFPGRNRSAAAPDNLNVLTGAGKTAPKPPMLNGTSLNGPEFVEFSLPVAAMQAVEGRWKIHDNHKVSSLSRGEFEASSLGELQDAISVAGSGGGYLSNEISYRAILLQQQFGRDNMAVGHIHTPKVTGYDAATETEIVEQARTMIQAAVGAL
ncbi:hypothetical protein LZP73_06140 [Shewanella sp. AS16]|uniref:hypothetical protein n=1 Tax=Shewanella sp. AS16 TaxID=2907625 RepID=UPI001F3DB6FF|nr:hypothetical protein [Shewanella sp. AS16]MCE9685796.1 hypothetical protein [Shewanella sp. AS16]